MEFLLLGGVEARMDGRPVDLGRRRERRLLGLLLLADGAPLSIERLLDLLWDDGPPRSARSTLQTHMSRLRSRIDPAGDGGLGIRLESGFGGYSASTDPSTVDVHRFRSLAAKVKDECDPVRRAERVRAALKLWQGPPLGEIAPAHLRERFCGDLEDLRMTLLEEAVDCELALGRHEQVTGRLHALVAEYPLRERFTGQLMLALYRCGRESEAIEAFQRLHDQLAENLGLDPTPGLRDLYTAILQRSPELDPEDVAPGTAEVPVPAPQRDKLPVPRQLPPVTGTFVGRAEPLRLLHEARSGPARTVLIVGAAGVGKSTLALQWAHANAGHFPDGQFFVPLRGFDPGPPATPAEALARMLGALGVSTDEMPGDLEDQSALLRSLLAGRRALIVLDDAKEPEQIRPLLPGGPGCFVLITSRDRLGGLVARDGARRIRLDMLGKGEALELLGDMAGHDRTAAEPEAAARLAELCGHLPLALRVAGARLADHPDYPLATFTADLRDLGHLAGLQVDEDTRASVRSTFDLSYQALPPVAGRLFRLLGLVPGLTVSTGAAAALAGLTRTDAVQALGALARLHMLQPVAPGRYACHDLLHTYAAERARAEDDADAGADAMTRLLTYTLASLWAATEAVYGPPETAPQAPPVCAVTPETFDGRAMAEAWLEAEWDGIAALIEYACAHGPQEFGWRLVDVAFDVLQHRLPRLEWIRLTEAGLAAARLDDDAAGMASLYLALAQARFGWSDLHDVLEADRRGLAYAREAGWRCGEAEALCSMGATLSHLGRVPEALANYEQAVAIVREIGNDIGEAAALNNLGTLTIQLGRLAEAEQYLTQSLAISTRIGHAAFLPVNQINLGIVHAELGRTATALEALETGLKVARDVGSPRAEGRALEAIGRTCAAAGRTAEAAAAYAEALEITRRCGDRTCQVEVLAGLAEAALDSGHTERALAQLAEALPLARDTGNSKGEVRVLIGLAHAYRASGDPRAARDHASQAERLAEEKNILRLTGHAQTALAAVAAALGDTADCRARAELAVRTLSANGQRPALPPALLLLAEARDRLGDQTGAERTRGRAHGILAELRDH